MAAGTLVFTGGGTSNGRYDVADGAAVSFGGGAYTLNAVTSGSGTGLLMTAGGAVTATGRNTFSGRLPVGVGVLDVAEAFQAGGLERSRGALTGAGTVDSQGAYPADGAGAP